MNRTECNLTNDDSAEMQIWKEVYFHFISDDRTSKCASNYANLAQQQYLESLKK